VNRRMLSEHGGSIVGRSLQLRGRSLRPTPVQESSKKSTRKEGSITSFLCRTKCPELRHEVVSRCRCAQPRRIEATLINWNEKFQRTATFDDSCKGLAIVQPWEHVRRGGDRGYRMQTREPASFGCHLESLEFLLVFTAVPTCDTR
jgi:hypothetical protein